MESVNKLIRILPVITLVLLSSCYKEADYYKNSEEIFEDLDVNIEATSLMANGASQTLITYSFPVVSDDELTKLKVFCSSGKFKESGSDSIEVSFVKLDDSKEQRYAEITYVASAVAGDVTIRTEVQNYYRNDIIVLSKADVESMSLSSSSFYIKNDTLKELNLVASLYNSSGIASAGKNVTISASSDVGFFNTEATLIGANGTASFTYVFTDTSYVGTINFTALSYNADGISISASKEVEVID